MAIEVLSSSNWGSMVSGTTQTPATVHHNASSGDLLVAASTARSPVTAPEGWELVAEQLAYGSPTTTTQTVALWAKTATDEAGKQIWFTQEGTSVFGLHIIAVRNGVLTANSASLVGEAKPLIAPSLTGMKPGSIQVSAICNIYALTSGETELSYSADWTQVSPKLRVGNRFAVAYAGGATGNNEVTYNSTTAVWSSVALEVMDKDQLTVAPPGEVRIWSVPL